MPFLSWYKTPLNIRLYFRERLCSSSLLQRVFISFTLLIYVHGTGWGWGRFMFAHVSDHSHPAPWVVVGRLPSWERLFFFFFFFFLSLSLSLPFTYLFFVVVVLEVVSMLVVPFVVYLCKKFYLLLLRDLSVWPLNPPRSGLPWVSFCVSFFTPFLMIGLHADVSAFSSGCTLYRLILFLNFWITGILRLCLKL